jgi:hypothetical protein
MAALRAPVPARGPWLTAVLNAGAAHRFSGRPVAVVVEAHRLVREDDEVGVHGRGIVLPQLRVPVGLAGEDVPHAEPGQQVTGERVAAEHHPGTAPDRHDRGGGRHLRRIGPDLVDPAQPRGLRTVEDDAQPVERGQRLGDGGRRRDPDRDARGPQRGDVLVPVLLGVGDHEVGRQGTDAVEIRPLRAADTGDVEIGRVRAPVGGADEQPEVRRGDRLGQRRDEADDPPGRRPAERRPQIVFRRR